MKILATINGITFYEKRGKCYFGQDVNGNNPQLTIENCPVNCPDDIAFKYLA